MPTDIRADGETYPTVHLYIAYNHKKWYNDTMGRILQELTACGGQGTYEPPEHVPLYDVLCGRINLETPTLQPISAENAAMWRVDFKKPVIKILKGETTQREGGKPADKYGLFYSVRVPEEIRRALEDTVLKGCRLIESGDFMVMTINRMPASRQAEEMFRQRLTVYDPGTRGDLHSICVKENGIMHRFKRYGKVIGFAPENKTGERNNILDIYRRVEEKLEEIGREQVEAQQIEHGADQPDGFEIEPPVPTQAEVDAVFLEALREKPAEESPHVDPGLREAGTVVVRRAGGEEAVVSGAGATALTSARPAASGAVIGTVSRQSDGNYYRFLGHDAQGNQQLVLEAYGVESQAAQLQSVQEALQLQPIQQHQASLVPVPGQAPVPAPPVAAVAQPAVTTADPGGVMRPLVPATESAQTTSTVEQPAPAMATVFAEHTTPTVQSSPASRLTQPLAANQTSTPLSSTRGLGQRLPKPKPKRTAGLVYSPENGQSLATSILRNGADSSDLRLDPPVVPERDRTNQSALSTSALEAREETFPLNQTLQQRVLSPMVNLIAALANRMDVLDRNVAVTVDALRNQQGGILSSLNRHIDATNSTVAEVDGRVTSFEGQVIPVLNDLTRGSAAPPAYGSLNLRAEGRTSPTLRSDYVGREDQPGVQLINTGPPGVEGSAETVLTGPQLYLVANQLTQVRSPGGLATVDFSIPGLTGGGAAATPAEYRTASQTPGSGRLPTRPEDQVKSRVRMFSFTNPEQAQSGTSEPGSQPGSQPPVPASTAGQENSNGQGAAALSGEEPQPSQPPVGPMSALPPIQPPPPGLLMPGGINSPRLPAVPPLVPSLLQAPSPRMGAVFTIPEDEILRQNQQNQTNGTT